jgi:hypothetical protein
MDALQENMRRYREERRPFVGGSYGERHAIIQGRTPGPMPVYIDAYAQIREDDSGANFYGETDDNHRRMKDEWDGANGIQWQMFLKFKRPIKSIREIYIAATRIDPNAVWSGIGAYIGTYHFQSFVQHSLIRLDMTPGSGTAADLSTVTWANSYFKTNHMSGGKSTLYNTADNYEEFSLPYLGGADFALLNPPDAGSIGGSSVAASRLSASYGREEFAPTPGDPANGPFYGIHLYFNPSYKGGFFTDPGAGVACDVNVLLRDPVAPPTGYALSHALGTDFRIIM